MPTETDPNHWAFGLNPRQAKFCEEYLVDLNGTQAAIRAGYSPNGRAPAEVAYQNLRKPQIAEAIAKLMALRPGITQTRIVDELALIGFARMGTYITIQEDGSAYVDLAGKTDEDLAAIGELTSEEYTEGRGDDARKVKRVKIKLSDKQAALERLAKITGISKDRHEVTGKDGEPLTPEVGTRDLARAVLDILRTAQMKQDTEE